MATTKEKSKYVAAEKRMTNNVATIKSLKPQLREVNSSAEDIERQTVEDYLKSKDFMSEKMRISIDGSMSY